MNKSNSVRTKSVFLSSDESRLSRHISDIPEVFMVKVQWGMKSQLYLLLNFKVGIKVSGQPQAQAVLPSGKNPGSY
jgi:hypothetical protein